MDTVKAVTMDLMVPVVEFIKNKCDTTSSVGEVVVLRDPGDTE